MVDVTEGQSISVCAMVNGATLEREVRVQLATSNLNEEKAACEITRATMLQLVNDFLCSFQCRLYQCDNGENIHSQCVSGLCDCSDHQ